MFFYRFDVVPMIGVYLLRFVPKETRDRLFGPVLTGDITTIVMLASAVLILMSLGLYLVAKARFQRNRLILEE